jgi:hypothetical protein
MEPRLEEPTGTILVNVVGSGGSGTTMLALMLGNSERGFTPGETRVWYRPWQPSHFGFGCWCGTNPCPVWEEIGTFPEHQVYLRAREVLGAEVIADSSKWLDWVRDAGDWARRDGMRVRNVLIWRDLVDLVHAWWRRGRLDRANAVRPEGRALIRKAMAGLEQRFVDYVSRLFEDGLDPIVVSYDRLIDDPPAVLARLCDQLGIAYRDGQERFWEGDHHTLFGNQTARVTIAERDGGKLGRPERSPDFERDAPALRDAIAASRAIQETLGRLRERSL